MFLCFGGLRVLVQLCVCFGGREMCVCVCESAKQRPGTTSAWRTVKNTNSGAPVSEEQGHEEEAQRIPWGSVQNKGFLRCLRALYSPAQAHLLAGVHTYTRRRTNLLSSGVDLHTAVANEHCRFPALSHKETDDRKLRMKCKAQHNRSTMFAL